MTESTSKSSGANFQVEYLDIDLKSILNLIKNSYKLILIITIIFFVAGIYYANTRPPVYQSTAMIQVGNNDISGAISSGVGGIAALAGLAGQSSSSSVETVLLQSPYVLGQVVRQLGLDISVSPHYSGFFARKWAAFRHRNNGDVSLSTLEVPDALLSKALILTVRNKDQYSLFTKNGEKILDGTFGKVCTANYFSQPVTIKVTALNAKPGAQFELIKQQIPDVANDLAGALSIKEEGISTGIMKIHYISGNRVQAQALLNAILTVAVEKNIEEKSQEAAKTFQFISSQLPISKKNLGDAENKFNLYGAKKGIFDPVIEKQALEENIFELQKQLETSHFQKTLLLQKFTSIHPLVILETEKEDRIESEIKKNKEKLMRLSPVTIKEIDMQRDTKIEESVYIGLSESAQRMEMMKASVISSLRILSGATYPISRIPVNKRAIIFGAIFFGLMFSLGIIFIRHVLSPVIEDPDVVERMIGIAVTAIIPFSEKQMSYNKKIKLDKLYAGKNPFLLSRENPNDISIEGIRSLRTAIQMALLEAKNNVIAITGCSPGVGKSFISSNLAALLSDLGKHILIIDSDIRLGKLSQSFGKAKAPGLSTYLKNEANLDEIIQNIIPGKLDFIATGLYPENPSELLSQNSLADLIQLMQSRYDLVIIDTPPILAVTDSALILRYAATNLMVLGVGKDQMREVLYAKKILEKAGIELTGLVFNTLKQQKAGFGHNYGYSNYSYTYNK